MVLSRRREQCFKFVFVSHYKYLLKLFASNYLCFIIKSQYKTTLVWNKNTQVKHIVNKLINHKSISQDQYKTIRNMARLHNVTARTNRSLWSVQTDSHSSTQTLPDATLPTPRLTPCRLRTNVNGATGTVVSWRGAENGRVLAPPRDQVDDGTEGARTLLDSCCVTSNRKRIRWTYWKPDAPESTKTLSVIMVSMCYGLTVECRKKSGSGSNASSSA